MDSDEAVARFALQLTAAQRPLYFYVATLVGHPPDAEDILQETNRLVWEKFDEYRPGTNFLAWVYKIAFFEVLGFRKRKAREQAGFSEQTLELLAQDAAAAVEEESAEQEALVGCLQKLSDRDRELIVGRYRAEMPVEALAQRFGRSAKTLYHSLSRIRASLLDCIRRTLAAEARS
jgi:RNA polymerase sigma-70 factor (ECF subfamily)